METVKFLVFLEAGILTLNLLLSWIIYLSNKEKLFKQATVLWGIFSLQFFAHGVTQQLTNNIIYESAIANGLVLSFANLFLVKIVYDLVGRKFTFSGKYIAFSLIGILAGTISYIYFDFPFRYYAYLNLMFPCIFGIIAINRLLATAKDFSIFNKILCLLVIVIQLHYLDYPLLRTVAWFAPYGFTTLTALHVAFAIILPTSSIKKISDDYASVLKQRESELKYHRDNLEDLVQKRTAELKETTTQLVEASRKAGMSEIVTGTLHNVGNVLNSMNISFHLIEKYFQSPIISQLEQLKTLIKKEVPNDNNKLGKIPAYLEELIKLYNEDNNRAQIEAKGLRSNIDDIKNIISAQQSIAGFKGLYQRIKITEVIDHTLKVIQASLERHNINVKVLIEDEIEILTDKLKIVQILINLISNAKNALVAVENKKIMIEASKRKSEAVIIVKDNGMGIVEQDLTQIFRYGFSKTKNGYGFGLHHSILSAKELGGNLLAHSDGHNKGASFTLLLPLNAKKVLTQ